MNATSSSSSADAFRSRTWQPAPARRELKPGERVDRHRVDVDAADVAARHRRAALAQQRADAVAEPGQVVPGDRAPDREVHPVKRLAATAEIHRRADR